MGPEIAILFFELWRQDDNGLRFLVGRYATLDAAERRLAELTRAPHKQIYWVVENRPPAEPAPPL